MTIQTSISALLVLFFVVAVPPAFAQVCAPAQLCGDFNDSSDVTVGDALSVLRRSIGLSVEMSCSCDGGGECPLGGATETEQVQCWDPLDTIIPILPIDCIGTGQDGEFRAGLPTNFIDNGDGTVSDLRTTLMWEKLSDDNTINDYNNLTYQWQGAFAKIGELNEDAFAGYNDWRLPQVRELATLLDFSKADPAVAPEFDSQCVSLCTVLTCSCTLPQEYWSSTTFQEKPDKAWSIDFKTGLIDPNSKKIAYYYVRAVRGGY